MTKKIVQQPVNEPLGHLHLPCFHDDQARGFVTVERKEVGAVFEAEGLPFEDADVFNPLDGVSGFRCPMWLLVQLPVAFQ